MINKSGWIAAAGLLLAFVYLLVYGYTIHWRCRYDKEMQSPAPSAAGQGAKAPCLLYRLPKENTAGVCILRC